MQQAEERYAHAQSSLKACSASCCVSGEILASLHSVYRMPVGALDSEHPSPAGNVTCSRYAAYCHGFVGKAADCVSIHAGN